MQTTTNQAGPARVLVPEIVLRADCQQSGIIRIALTVRRE